MKLIKLRINSKILRQNNVKNISIVGGVSANKRFREKAIEFQKQYGVIITFPDLKYCTDNAAMIAMAGYIRIKNNKISDNNDIYPQPNLNF